VRKRFTIWLAYSTGQGVAQDMSRAQMVQPCGDARRGSAKGWRNQMAAEMNPSQIAQAQKLAREWLSIFK